MIDDRPSRTSIVPLDRRFVAVSKNQKVDHDWTVAMAGVREVGLDWAQLLTHRRIVMLAESGMGKTEELKLQAAVLRGAQRPAFYLRLEELQDQQLIDATGGEADRVALKAWLRGGGEGFFFLDSVDEARLRSRAGFAAAIRNFRAGIGSALMRSTIVISSRPQPDWRDEEDRTLFGSLLPEPQHKAMLTDDEMQVQSTRSNDAEESSSPFVVALLPLNSGRAGNLVQSRLGARTGDFLEAVERANAQEMLTRPADVIDVAEYWQEHGRLGSYRDVMAATIVRRLREDSARAQARPLDADKAMRGAEDLAAALVLSRRGTIVGPGASAGAAHSSVRAEAVLASFDAKELYALLARPLFEMESFEQLRFGRRSFREFLYACWLRRLLNGGAPFDQIRALLISDRYGVQTTMPYAATSAAWLAQMNDRFRDEILRIEPELLLQAGDPAQLPSDTRHVMLRRFVERYRARPNAHMSIDIRMVLQLAAPDLEPYVVRMLRDNPENAPIRELMLRLCWQGRYRTVATQALQIALSRAADDYFRILAARCLVAIDDPDSLRTLARRLLARPQDFPQRVTSEILNACYPKLITAQQFAKALTAVASPKRFSVGINTTLAQIAHNLHHATTALRLVAVLVPLLKTPPYNRDSEIGISKRFGWMLEGLENLLAVILAAPARAKGNAILEAIELVFAGTEFGFTTRSNVDSLAAQLDTLPQIRLALFWRGVRRVRKRLAKKAVRLEGWWQVHEYGQAWRFGPDDLPLLLAELRRPTNLGDRSILLGMIVELWTQKKRTTSVLRQIETAIKGDRALRKQLVEMRKPLRKSTQMLAMERQSAARRKRIAKQRDQQIRAETVFIKKIRGRIRSFGRIGVVPNARQARDLFSLTHWLLEKAPNLSRYSDPDFNQIERVFGVLVMQVYLKGIAAYWRGYRTTLLSEGELAQNTTIGTVTALMGVTAEWRRDPYWYRHLSARDAETALRHALAEMNGFPPWFEDFARAHPMVTRRLIKREIGWEWTAKSEQAPYYVLSDLAYASKELQNIVAPDLLARLNSRPPRHQATLNRALNLIARTPTGRSADFLRLCSRSTRNARTPSVQAQWLAVWLSANTAPALSWLQVFLSRNRNKAVQDELVKLVLSKLFDREGGGLAEIQAIREGDVASLGAIAQLCFRHVRVAEDAVHDHAYSPDARDRAEEARRYFLDKLFSMPGPDAFAMLQVLARDSISFPPYLLETFRDRAVMRAALDGEQPAWPDESVRVFAQTFEKPPLTLDDLFALIEGRLRDIDHDLQHGDFSERDILQSVTGEAQAQRWFASRLRELARGLYSVAREEEVINRKETDIRIHVAGVGVLTIEVKLADRWTYRQLLSGCVDQLVGQYLKDRRGTAGLYLLVNRGRAKGWDIGLHKHQNFEAVVRALRASLRPPAATRIGVFTVDVAQNRFHKIGRKKCEPQNSTHIR